MNRGFRGVHWSKAKIHLNESRVNHPTSRVSLHSCPFDQDTPNYVKQPQNYHKWVSKVLILMKQIPMVI